MVLARCTLKSRTRNQRTVRSFRTKCGSVSWVSQRSGSEPLMLSVQKRAAHPVAVHEFIVSSRRLCVSDLKQALSEFAVLPKYWCCIVQSLPVKG